MAHTAVGLMQSHFDGDGVALGTVSTFPNLLEHQSSPTSFGGLLGVMQVERKQPLMTHGLLSLAV